MDINWKLASSGSDFHHRGLESSRAHRLHVTRYKQRRVRCWWPPMGGPPEPPDAPQANRTLLISIQRPITNAHHSELTVSGSRPTLVLFSHTHFPFKQLPLSWTPASLIPRNKLNTKIRVCSPLNFSHIITCIPAEEDWVPSKLSQEAGSAH